MNLTQRREVLRLAALRASAAIVICIIFLIPILWMLLTAFKPQQDVIKVPPKVFFTPSLQGFVNLFF